MKTIAIMAPIYTDNLLSKDQKRNLNDYPKGCIGAPLVSLLIKEYQRRGYNVLAITTDNTLNDCCYEYISKNLTYIVIPIRRHAYLPNGWRLGRLIDAYYYERRTMVKILKKYKPDIVHAHWTYEYALAALIYDRKAIVTIHDDPVYVLSYFRDLYRLIRLLVARRVFKIGNNFTAVSPYIHEAVRNNLKKDAVIIPNPIDGEIVQEKRIKNKLIIITISNSWDKRKNNKVTFDAFKKIKSIVPEAILWAIGAGYTLNGDAFEYCRDNNIEGVVLHGHINYIEVINKIAESSILIHTSLEESFGMILAEAMGQGVPVIAGKNSGAVSWVVNDGGILVDVTNYEEVVEATISLLRDDTYYKDISKKAIENVKGRFSLEKVVDEYINFYNTIN